ncbi:MAG: class I SAM-dependent methyltransferase [Gammaproteobacteria bacterium]
MSTIADKWDNIYSQQNCADITPSTVLVENAHLLPGRGKALDLACGLGANAIYLAQSQLQVDAWDVSSKALKKLEAYSQLNNLSINTSVRDVEKTPPERNYFDVVTVSQFLHRPTFHNLYESLRIEGLLFYQTYTSNKAHQIGPTNPNFLLKKNELLKLCDGMEVLVYREEGVHGDIHQGWRNQAMIVAKRVK